MLHNAEVSRHIWVTDCSQVWIENNAVKHTLSLWQVPCSCTCSLTPMIFFFLIHKPIRYLWIHSHANMHIPLKLTAGHKYKPAAFRRRWCWAPRLHQFRGTGFHPSTLRVNLSLAQFKFIVAVTLISVKPLPHTLMYASYLNPIYLLWMTENNSCCWNAVIDKDGYQY